MQKLNKVGAIIMIAGFVLIAAGGMSIKRGPDGTWVRVNQVNVLGGGLLLGGMLLAAMGAFASDKTKTEP